MTLPIWGVINSFMLQRVVTFMWTPSSHKQQEKHKDYHQFKCFLFILSTHFTFFFQSLSRVKSVFGSPPNGAEKRTLMKLKVMISCLQTLVTEKLFSCAERWRAAKLACVLY